MPRNAQDIIGSPGRVAKMQNVEVPDQRRFVATPGAGGDGQRPRTRSFFRSVCLGIAEALIYRFDQSGSRLKEPSPMKARSLRKLEPLTRRGPEGQGHGSDAAEFTSGGNSTNRKQLTTRVPTSGKYGHEGNFEVRSLSFPMVIFKNVFGTVIYERFLHISG